MVLLVSPDDDVPPEVQSVAEQLSSTEHSNRDVTITLILHGFQAALGTRDLQALHTALEVSRQRLNTPDAQVFPTFSLEQISDSSSRRRGTMSSSSS